MDKHTGNRSILYFTNFMIFQKCVVVVFFCYTITCMPKNVYNFNKEDLYIYHNILT